jgi:hypothetical protein
MTMMENGMPTVSVQTVTTVASLGLCVRHAKTPDLYMSQEMCDGAGKPGWVNRASRVTWRQQVRAGVQRLVLVGRPGNEFPEVGQVCLVLRKNDKKDLGQEAVVTKRTASRVHITIRDDNGWQATRVKHPGSIILFEDGLHVSQDANGFIWVRNDAI